MLRPPDVAARFRAARRAGRPFWLWPDVEPTAWRAAMAELERVTAVLLRPGGTARLAAADAAGLRALGVAAYTSGLGPWLGWQHEQGGLAADAETAVLLAEHLAHARRRATRLGAGLKAVTTALGDAGVRVTVLKGMHTSRAYFAEPGLRPMADIDVLVAAPDLPVARGALLRAGFVEDRAARHTRPYRSEWRPAGSALLPCSLDLSHADDPWAVDLHGSLDVDFVGVRTVGFDRVLEGRCAPASWLPHAAVPAQPLLAAHLAIHASHGLHGATLIRLLELVLVLRADMRVAADWAALAELLRMLDAERFAYPALLLTERLAPGAVDGALLERLAAVAPPRLRAVLAPLRPATAQRLERLDLRERFMWSAGAIEHARRVLHMLLPVGILASPRRLARIYRARAWRLLRRQITWGGA